MKQSDERFRRRARSMWADLCGEGRGWILFAVSAGWFLSIGLRYVYPSVLPFLRSDFGLDLTTAGLLLSTLWLAYALGQFPGGVLGDEIGEGNVLAVSTVLSTIAVSLVAVSPNAAVLFGATAVFGLATGLYGPHRFTIFTDVYGARSGTAVGVTMSAGSIGNTVLPALCVTVAGYASWRAGFGLLVPVFVAVCLLLRRAVPARTSASTADTDTFSRDTLRRVAKSVTGRGIPVVVSIHVVLAFVSNAFLGFYPTYLISIKEFSPGTAALLYGLYFALGVAVQPMVGVLRDRFGPRPSLLLVSGSVTAGLLALQVSETVLHVIFLTVLIAQRNGLGVVTNTYIADALADDIKGSGLGLLRTTWILTGALSPVLVGFLGDLGRLNAAFFALSGIAAAAFLLSLLVPNGD